MKVDNIEQFIQEECPYIERCPLSDSDEVYELCTGFYIDCPRFVNYIKEEAYNIENRNI